MSFSEPPRLSPRRVTGLTQHKNNKFNLQAFCTDSVPDFTPLGGSRPDAAVVACASIKLFTERLAEEVILPPDVLDTALATLCAPLIVTHVGDLRGREAHFRCPAATVRLRTIDDDVLGALQRISADMEGGGLSVTVQLEEAMEALPDEFMEELDSLMLVDMRPTVLQRVGHGFLYNCPSLTSVAMPDSLRDIDYNFLNDCTNIERVDLRHTVLLTVGDCFLCDCTRLISLNLPESLTDVSDGFLLGCSKIQHVDLRHTALRRVGDRFLYGCSALTNVDLPPLHEVGSDFLFGCYSLQHDIPPCTQ